MCLAGLYGTETSKLGYTKSPVLGGFRIEENCRLRQKYSICLLKEVVVLGYFADKAQVYRTMFCESGPFLIAV